MVSYYWNNVNNVYLANLLGNFSESADSALHSNRSRQQALSLKYWLKFLLSLSYYSDGQENILRIKNILDYFCDIFEFNLEEQKMVLHILHNLSFSTQNRIRLAQHSGILSCFKVSLYFEIKMLHA